MKILRFMAGVIVLNDVLFVVGGCNGQSLESVEIYVFEIDIWMIIVFMKEFRSGVGIVVIDGLLYVFGGYNGIDYFNSVEVFYFQKKRWILVISMKINRRRFGCCLQFVQIIEVFILIDYFIFLNFKRNLSELYGFSCFLIYSIKG